MKKTLLGLLLSTSLLAAGAVSVSADETTVMGETAENITVNGTLGADDTDPGTEVDPGDPFWINVTFNNANTFYNASGSTAVRSLDYTVTNNSGRGVDVSYGSFIKASGDDVTRLNLSLVPSSGETIKLLGSSPTNQDTKITTLGTGNTLVDGTKTPVTDGSNVLTYKYDGTLDSASSAVLKPVYNLVLRFKAN
ncbi:hypothetical protein [Enterococcus bulliens]